MDSGYEVYCLGDKDFYDSPVLARGDHPDFAGSRRAAPEGWVSGRTDDWQMFAPSGHELPSQGWKIHVSACLDNAEQILDVVWDYCARTGVAFKYIRSRDLLFLRNMKYANRGFSGKFITIFPADEAQLQTILEDLAPALDGQSGPYILSDLRWGEGPLYVRYGGFADRWCMAADGELVPAIEDADGELVPDRRTATFQVPPGIAMPACLEPHLQMRNSATMEDLPYRVERALHFSNGGGLYVGVDTRSDEQVVLKEARPYAGLGMDEEDAVTRLRRECDMQRNLSGLGVVPEARDFFEVGDHHFLVMDFVEGEPLNVPLVQRYPLIVPHPSDDELETFTSWALAICERLESAVGKVHERGIVLGDLHPSNVLVRPDDSVVLIDLEIASHVSEGRRPPIADPGFMAPRDAIGFDIDRYALACMRLHLFMPLTTLFVHDPSKARELADEIAREFPSVPREFLAHAVRVIEDAHPARPSRPPRRGLVADAAGWSEARCSMAGAILASATPQRDDRLFPGDPQQFSSGGLNLAYGAAGVLWALHATGAGRHPDHETWLVEHALHPEPGTRLGFYDGLHGVAFALRELGREDDAASVLDICRSELHGRWKHFGLDLLGGLSGIGLNFAHFAAATGDDALWREAAQISELVAERLGGEDDVSTLSGGKRPYAGLLRGSSGPALLFLRMYERFAEPALLDLAATALRQDLRRCVVRDDGAMDVNEGWRTMPYLADGSIGIGLVLDDYLAVRDDEQFATASAQIRRTAQAAFFIEPGLFWGRAGMIAYLSRGHAPGTAADADALVASHVQRLAWHALSYRGEIAFPGQQLLRLSMDLATGTAGVLLAIATALHDEPVQLPLLPTRAPAARPREERDVLLTNAERR
ncbi:MAG: protein kinase/lanthionine synthetase C family protein [Solirubrobacterales bacterium]|nr:protein kinase/lanthionine synthetase C family protein [Solirubrobacterales bacterium]